MFVCLSDCLFGLVLCRVTLETILLIGEDEGKQNEILIHSPPTGSGQGMVLMFLNLNGGEGK